MANFHGGRAGTSHHNLVIVLDCYRGGSECDITSGIAQGADGDEGMRL